MSDDARILELVEEALSSQVTPEEVCAAIWSCRARRACCVGHARKHRLTREQTFQRNGVHAGENMRVVEPRPLAITHRSASGATLEGSFPGIYPSPGRVAVALLRRGFVWPLRCAAEMLKSESSDHGLSASYAGAMHRLPLQRPGAAQQRVARPLLCHG